MSGQYDTRPVGESASYRVRPQASNPREAPSRRPSDRDYVVAEFASAHDSRAFDVVSYLTGLLWLRKSLIVSVALLFGLTVCVYAYYQDDIFESTAEVNLLPTMNVSEAAEGSRVAQQNAAYVAGRMRLLVSLGLIVHFLDGLTAEELSEIRRGGEGFSGIYYGIRAKVVSMLSRIAPRILPRDANRPPPEGTTVAGADKGMEQADAPRVKLDAHRFRRALGVRLSPGLGRENGIVEVSFRANRPEVAEKTLRAFLECYGQVVRYQMIADLEAQRKALKEQLARAEHALMQSEGALSEFASANRTVAGVDNAAAPFINLVNRSVERIGEVREERERIRALLLEPDASSKAAPPMKPVEDPALTAMRQQLAELEIQYAEWKTVYSPKSLKMRQIEKRIDDLSEKVESAAKRATDAALETADIEEKVREHTLDESRRAAERMNSLQSGYTFLKKKVESDNQVRRKLLDALGDVDLRAGSIPSGVNIIEPPTRPSGPTGPRRRLMIAIGILMGLVCGVALASVTENAASRNKVLDVDKMAAEIRTRSLGIVPDFDSFVSAAGKSKKCSGRRPFPPDLAGNDFAHIIRDMETALFFSHSDEQSRVTLISSAISKEGKTFLATSLSWAMSAREGQRTLMIDADMRKPSVHELFGHKEPGTGLSTLLTDRRTKISDIVRRSQFPGLCYITAGSVPSDPLALLRSSRFRQLLAVLGRHFDNIVIDSPPILSFPDYMPLCYLAKSVMLVVRQGETLREEVRKSAALIRGVPGTRLLGVVLNRAEVSAGRYRLSMCHHSRHHACYRAPYESNRPGSRA